MSRPFSSRTRTEALARMRAERFDVLVIGGGIVGAAVARDAALRGLRTALVEKGDFAGGTSGRTSRLIHGGLRYLRDLRIGIVRQAVRERDRLLRLAPALVRPLRFVIPVYAGAGPGPWSVRLGLFLYDALSREKALPRRRWLPPDAALELEPALARRGLRGAGVYHDAWADDARLVLAVVRDAAAAGAAIANHAEAVDLVREAGVVVGARVVDRFGAEPFDVRAHAVVAAAGPWLDRLRGPRGRVLRPTKGVHVLVPRDRIGNREGIALTSVRDGRVVFALPWGDLALLGTTDTDFDGDPDRVLPEAGDVDYLLESANARFPEARLARRDAVSAYAGLRPLVPGRRGGASESGVSRAHEVFEDPDGLLSVAGGKLTTQRAMAEDVVDRVSRRLRRGAPCGTRDRPLGPPPGGARTFRAAGLDEEAAVHLGTRHDPEDVERWLGEPGARERIDPDLPYLWAEVSVAAESEMAMTLADVMVRRLGLFYEGRDQGRGVARAVAERLARHLGWDYARVEAEVRAYGELVDAHRGFLTPDGR